ncbi:signal peptidase I [Brevibacillus sp. SYSU BS000544]|uniref:signal peptidase I n=1 Tax=Brevibacillus sp. SYSU BS000544 TaxID=3416443 RepID=UPI003CE4BD87
MVYLKKTISILTTTLLILVIALSGFLLVGKLNGGKTTLLGNEIMVVLSGSMSPTFDTGSIVAVKPVTFQEVAKGDIVTFKDLEDRTITHRVIDIVDGKLITKGDANDGKDLDPVTSDRLIGEVQYSVPYLGYIIDFVKSKVGMLLFLGVPGLYIIVSQIWKLFRMMKEAEDQKSANDPKTQV